VALKLYIIFETPSNYYYTAIPAEITTLPPLNYSYKMVELKTMLQKLIAKYPGSLRDLQSATDIPAVALARTARNDHAFYFAQTVTHESIIKLIKLYYQYVIAVSAES
jgi:hypothetical protein